VLSARLQAAGAQVSAYDPIAEEEARRLMPRIEFAGDVLECVTGADAVVLVTEWDEFKSMDLDAVAERMAGRVLIDGRNALDPAAARAAGLTYEGIGQG
jgi:UDPglucose 6-dehydrogenase